MSNHPWRENSRMFSCTPNCPKRKPGCQDHCEQHAKDKANYNKRKKIAQLESSLDDYVRLQVMNSRDKRNKY